MEWMKLTHENLEQEHICCAISNNRDIQVMSKKAWLSDLLDEGLVFLKANVRGKCFIEYIPAEYAWAPVDAAGYLFIHCLWGSGQWKGQGYSNQLLDACIRDGRETGKKGICVISSAKKKGFLADPGYFRHKNFQLADTAEPHFELLYLPFLPDAEKPHFRSAVREPIAEVSEGFTLYYTHQCPFTAKYVPLLEEAAKARGVMLKLILLSTREAAQHAPCPFTAFALYYRGKFITHDSIRR